MLKRLRAAGSDDVVHRQQHALVARALQKGTVTSVPVTNSSIDHAGRIAAQNSRQHVGQRARITGHGIRHLCLFDDPSKLGLTSTGRRAQRADVAAALHIVRHHQTGPRGVDALRTQGPASSSTLSRVTFNP